MRTWFLHWLSAGLVLAVLLASLPVSYPAWLVSEKEWTSIHMSIGWTLVAITAIRLLLMLKPDRMARVRILRPRGPRAWLKILLLFSLVAVLATGAVIYRPSPLGFSVYLFGLLKAGAIVDLGHATHMQVISAHRYLAYALAALYAVHAWLAFRRTSKAAILPVSWIWTGVARRR